MCEFIMLHSFIHFRFSISDFRFQIFDFKFIIHNLFLRLPNVVDSLIIVFVRCWMSDVGCRGFSIHHLISSSIHQFLIPQLSFNHIRHIRTYKFHQFLTPHFLTPHFINLSVHHLSLINYLSSLISYHLSNLLLATCYYFIISSFHRFINSSLIQSALFRFPLGTFHYCIHQFVCFINFISTLI